MTELLPDHIWDVTDDYFLAKQMARGTWDDNWYLYINWKHLMGEGVTLVRINGKDYSFDKHGPNHNGELDGP